MTSKFSIDFFSDKKYDYMTAEISYGGQILCQINQDKGIENLEIEFFHDQIILKDQPVMKFTLDEFFSVINDVKRELTKYR